MTAAVNEPQAHPELHILRARLHTIYTSIAQFKPSAAEPAILDSSVDLISTDPTDDSQRRQQETIPGLRNLKETVKRDLDVLESFLADPESVSLPALSTNAPYLIAVWNEVLRAPSVTAIFKSFPLKNGERSADPRRTVPKVPGVKVDVVADDGRQWIRVNTMKNSRMLSELCVIDSYLTDSGDDSDDLSGNVRPSLVQKEFDNSVLRMGRSLLKAAEENVVPGTSTPPRVVLCLARLDPSLTNTNGEDTDPRIAQTIECLRELGIEVRLGERDLDIPTNTSPPAPYRPLEPTSRVNLDLSLLIALISDITHSPLPQSSDEAIARFAPSDRYLEWKKQRVTSLLDGSGKNKGKGVNEADDGGEVIVDTKKHSRALANQALQEMSKGLLQDMSDRLSAASPKGKLENVEFWTTPEARERCMSIVSKIGGPNERRRAQALFQIPLDFSQTSTPSPEAEEAFWRGSRYPQRFIPLLPLHLYPSSEPNPDLKLSFETPASRTLPAFCRSLTATCLDILAQETIPHPRALPLDTVQDHPEGKGPSREIQRAMVTKANTRLTAHTAKSMLWGAQLGLTTLTANRSSIKAILREMKTAKAAGKLEVDRGADTDETKAAIWIVEPRSLAEGMRSDCLTSPPSK